MALNDIIKQQVAGAFTNILGPGGLTETIDVKFYVSEGTYDVDTDTTEPVFRTESGIVAVIARPTTDDVKNNNEVMFTDAKLIIPGPFLTAEPQTDTDFVIRANGEQWDIRKTVGVPGGSIWIVYIYRT